jgi:hypothetical protein
MHWPDARVVLVPLENNITGSTVGETRLHKLNITTLSVIGVDDSAIPVANTLSEDVEIVTVEMLGVLC